MSRNYNEIRTILAMYSDGAFSADRIPDDVPIFGTGGIVIKSLNILEVLCEIEQTFDINIPDEDLTEELFASVASLEEYVKNHAHPE